LDFVDAQGVGKLFFAAAGNQVSGLFSSVVPVVTFIQTLQIKFFDCFFRKVGKAFPEAVQEKVLGKLRKLEGLHEPRVRRQAAKRLNVNFVIRMGLNDHG